MLRRSEWQPTQEQVDAAWWSIRGTDPAKWYHKEGQKELLAAALIAARAAAPEVDTTAFEAAVEAYCDASDMLRSRISIASWVGHSDDPSADRIKKESLIAEALDKKRHTHDSLIDMFKDAAR